MNFSILGTGSSLPKRVISNNDLSTFLDTNDEWIRTRTGIERRHILSADETVTSISISAAQNALENAGVSAQDIDFVLCCTIGGDFVTPSLACLVQAGIGANCPAMDMNNGCAGFIYALEIAAGMFARGRTKKVLIVAGEALSRVADWTDRSTCVLFGDGAGAVVLGEGDDLLSMHLTSEGAYENLFMPYPAGNMPEEMRSGMQNAAPSKAVSCGAPYIYMNGAEIYKFAVNAITSGVQTVLKNANINTGDVNHLLLHQANLRIIDAAVKKIGIPPENCPTVIAETGNVSAATIPILMDIENRKGRFKKNDILILSAFGAGLATGSAAIRWSK